MNEKDVLNEEYNILQSHYFNCIYSNYFAFANRFSCDLTLCKTVGEHLRGNLQDQYSNIIVEVLTLTDRILPFISMLIQWEILHTNNKENLLRGNNLCTKVVTYYLKRTLRGFARKVLTPHITEIIETNKSYEIDKITLGNTIDQSIIKENQNNLKCISIKIIDSLVQNVHQFPKEANTICNLIWTSLQGKYPEDAKLPSQLVGGILFLRVLCSFIATPDTNNLLLPGTKLIPSSRRKLILVSKTLQAISNVSTNSFDSVLEQMKEVLIQQIPRLHELYRIVSLDSTILPINDLVSKDIPLRQCDINIFFSLHYLFNQAKENHLTSNQNRTELRLSLNPKYSNSMAQIDFNQIKEEDAKISSSSVRKRVFPLKTPQRIEKSNDLFSLDVKPIKKKDLSLCKIENTEEKSNENQQNDLPPFLLQKPSSPKPLQEPSKRRSYRRSLYGGTIDIDSSYKDLSNLIGPTPFEPIKSFKKIVEWEIPEIDEDIQSLLSEEKIFYIGGISDKQIPIIYLNIKRLCDTLQIGSNVSNWDKIIQIAMEKTKMFEFVIDCSWFSLNSNSNDYWNKIIKTIHYILSQPEIKQNISVYLLHPTKLVINSFQSLFKEENIQIIDNYNILELKWGESNTLIPEDSKNFVKTNQIQIYKEQKGKMNEEQLIMSLVEIMSIKKNKIQWELEYKDIDKIMLYEQKMNYAIIRSFTEGKLNTIQIKFDTITTKDEFIKKLYESCFYRSMLDNNCLIVYAENISIKKGKKVIGNSCILMICLDSFIVKKGNEIELSIGFAAIERVSVLPYNDLTSKIQICYKDVKDPLLNSTIKEWLIEKKNEQIREKLNYMIEKFNETKNQM
ncbi:GTPase-activator protein for Ras family GTPase [Entamoeba histolytica HM-1:IMSS-B]|uniref:Ras-GAP domain-containing protein n=4 Tax=Entamoeba histolytica TaxID=5759 RepID=A0A175JIM5_ENTHI|nr:GTPase-activator protein for Ras family GTPase [Entamoeba histolytica HM-1:IMSS-B]EMS17332.1 GTPase-activator protein for Ras family GTPase [Entamoeba histolytica HM-3:IMSS]GAT93560.1 hypothetical protein CL6EHI_014300 [Entamoeba histolytica]